LSGLSSMIARFGSATNSPSRAPETILHGRLLLLARSACALIVVSTLAIFIASLPAYFALFHSLCALEAQCASGQLTARDAAYVHSLGLSLDTYATLAVITKAVSVFVWVAVAGLIFWRKSNHWLALLVALMLVTVGTGNADTDMVVLERLFSPSLAFFVGACSNFLSTLSVFLVLSLFPDGRFVPHWTRWALLLALAWAIVNFFPPLITTFAVTLLGDVLWAGCLALLIIAQIYRYFKVSTLTQRQQTRWVVFGLALLLVLAIVETAPGLIFPTLGQPYSPLQIAFSLTPLLIPLSFGAALLRSRLWDVDALINRALVYGTLTVSLALVYAGLILGLQALSGAIIKQNSGVALVVSTLAIYALFQPLRRRIQAVIDRRFYRRKYDAQKTLAAFSAALRNEVDLSQLSEQLVSVVQETMQPAHVSLWLRPPTYGQSAWRGTSNVTQKEEAGGEI
jgi:hypothetical protein